MTKVLRLIHQDSGILRERPCLMKIDKITRNVGLFSKIKIYSKMIEGFEYN